MVTYTIVPHTRTGTYFVVATRSDGMRTTVATYPTEQDAVARLKHLQERVETVEQRQARNGSR